MTALEAETRLVHMHHHPVPALAPAAGRSERELDAPAGLVARLMRCFLACDTWAHYGRDSQWRTIAAHVHPELSRILASGSEEAMRAFLADPGSNRLLYGFEDLYSGRSETYRDNPALASQWALRCHDLLVRLAEAIGALRIANPECESHWTDNSNLDPDAVVDRIEDVLGIAIAPPRVYSGFWGLRTRRGVLTERMLSGLYTAWRAKQLLEDRPRPAILEIGAGLGWSAYYANRMGLRDYTIVDVPITNLSQGWFLGCALGADAIALEGEPGGPDLVRIGTRGMLREVPAREFDLAINVDSLTEISQEIAGEYAAVLERRCATVLSINHEVNAFTAHELFRAVKQGVRMQRHPYWLRNGYVEEILEFR